MQALKCLSMERKSCAIAKSCRVRSVENINKEKKNEKHDDAAVIICISRRKVRQVIHLIQSVNRFIQDCIYII